MCFTHIHPHFTDEKTEAQKGFYDCLKVYTQIGYASYYFSAQSLTAHKVLLLSTIVKNEGSTVTWNNGYKIILNEKIIRVVYIVAM